MKKYTLLLLIISFVSFGQMQTQFNAPGGTFLEDVVVADSNTVMVTGSNLYRTTIDGGRTWIGLSSGGMFVKAAHFPSIRFGIAVGNQGNYRINDECGYFWGWGNNKYIGINKDLLDVYFTDNQKGTVVGNDGTIRYTTNQGTNWLAINSGTTNYIRGVFSTNDTTTYVCTNAGLVIKIVNYQVDSVQTLNSAINFNKIQFVNDSTGFVVGSAGTIYKTSDFGTTWNLLTSNSTDNLLNLAFLDQNIGIVTTSSGKLLRTSNSGNTWVSINSLQTTEIRAVAFKNNKVGFAVGSNFVLQTLDKGLTWARIDGDFQSVHFPTKEVGYTVAYYGAAHKTTDGGTNWKPMNFNTIQYFNDVYFLNKDTGYAVGGNEIHRTLDGGETWNKIINPATSSLYAVHFSDYMHGVAGGYRNNLLYTSNGGVTWQITQNSSSTVYIMDYKFPTSAIGYYCNNIGGIAKTTNYGQSWTTQASNASSGLANLCFINQNLGWAVGGSGTIVKTTNGGTNWVAQTSGTTNFLNGVHFVNANKGVVVGSSGTYLITTNGGTTWLNRTTTSVDYKDVFFTDSLHGYVAGNGGVSSIYPFTIQGGTAPVCAGDNFNFNVFDGYHIANVPTPVVLELTTELDDFSNAIILDSTIIDSVGAIVSKFPDNLTKGIYKARIRNVADSTQVSNIRFISVAQRQNIGFTLQGNVLYAYSDLEVTFTWIYKPTTSSTFQYLATGDSVVMTVPGEYYLNASTGCCNVTSETKKVILCNGNFYFEPSPTVNNLSVCYGDSIVIGNTTYFISGSYTDTLVNSIGCDSIVITNLEVKNLIETNVIVSGDTLNALETNATFQWINCNDNSIIQGETNPQFIAIENGSYAVIVTKNNCSDTSDCVNLTTVGIDKFDTVNSFQIYPNPSDGIIYLNTDLVLFDLQVTNLVGEIIFEMTDIQRDLKIKLIAKGVYFLKIKNENKSYVRKVVIN